MAVQTGEVLSQSSRVGTQREYETVIILRPETSKVQISELIERMQKVFADRGSRLLKIDSWGIRVLAYPVERNRKGIYLYWRYLGGSDIVAEFERHMRLSDRVMRFYTVRVDQDVDPEARPTEVTEELLEQVSEPGPDPDEVARQRAAEEEARRAAAAAAAAEARKEEAEADSSSDDDGSGEEEED